MTRRVLTTRQAADALACSPGTVRRLCEAGRLRFTRFVDGGNLRIYADSVESLLGAKGKRSVNQKAASEEARASAARLSVQFRDVI